MIEITIRYGATTEIKRSFPEGTTVGTIINDRNLQAYVGFGSNVQGVVNGEVQDIHASLEDGDILVVETKANAKAA